MSNNYPHNSNNPDRWRGLLHGEGTFLLPTPTTAEGQPRRVGIEVEFADLDLPDVAGVVTDCLGGLAQDVGQLEWHVTDTRLGKLKVFRDIYLRKTDSKLMTAGLRMAGDLIPVELVTEPVRPDDFPLVETLLAALRDKGATGTREGFMHGYGVHLNPEVVAPTAADIVPVVRAFGLLEDWLRNCENLTGARRILPFIEPWPLSLVDRFAHDEAADWSLEDLISAYLAETDSRNHSLDMLPLFLHLDENHLGGRMQVAAKVSSSVSGRPTYHYRLPESRINEPDWTLAREWNSWVVVERAAANPALIAALSQAYRQHRTEVFGTRHDWAQKVAHLLAAPDSGAAPDLDASEAKASDGSDSGPTA